MKIKLLSLAVATALCVGFAEARFYIGVEGGYTGGLIDKEDRKLDQKNSSYLILSGASAIGNAFKSHTFATKGGSVELEPWKGFNVALSLGSEHFFANNYLGLRWGASVGYTEIMQDVKHISKAGNKTTTETRGYVDAGLSADMIVNLYSSRSASFGIFGGAEVDYHYLVLASYEEAPNLHNILNLAPSRHSMEFLGRVGLSTMFAGHHRIDLTAKLPFAYLAAGSDNTVRFNGYEPIKTSFNIGYKYIF